MSWQTWEYGTDEKSQRELASMIFSLMREVAIELDDPPLNEWFDAGIEIMNDPYGDEAVIVYYELQETDMTDVDGTMRPGYTLTLQLSDGQQDAETFFEDDEERWEDIAEYFADRIVRGTEPRYGWVISSE